MKNEIERRNFLLNILNQRINDRQLFIKICGYLENIDDFSKEQIIILLNQSLEIIKQQNEILDFYEKKILNTIEKEIKNEK